MWCQCYICVQPTLHVQLPLAQKELLLEVPSLRVTFELELPLAQRILLFEAPSLRVMLVSLIFIHWVSSYDQFCDVTHPYVTTLTKLGKIWHTKTFSMLGPRTSRQDRINLQCVFVKTMGVSHSSIHWISSYDKLCGVIAISVSSLPLSMNYHWRSKIYT